MLLKAFPFSRHDCNPVAFSTQQEPTSTGFVDGPAAAVAAHCVEAKAGNTGYAPALTTLQRVFSDPDQDGPIRAAEFLPGNGSNRDRVR